ncbi:hypothetical protein IFM89_009195 [Coptis chinensis]|uniref:JmjC domain-containing protein n=1 Tax=Coptis chinensis TaxID=261450 RepID=A0A835IXZ8_9MAGN|nr:hypothetical protein IFM89_009195 [Coptis chinensis]
MKKEANEIPIQNLWQEVRELSLGTTSQIDHLPHPPTPLQFHRNYISQNKPCIISNATNHWPALKSWTQNNYLTQTLSHSTISLHLTPNGLADSVIPYSNNTLCFASAHVEKIPFPNAIKKIISTDLSYVAYAQEQNDCFRTEYSALSGDVESDISWASEALGCLPEAVNLWIGNHKSQTSFHKDHYENLYVVISGEKHFTLLPPTDFHRLYIESYPAAQYHFHKDSGEFSLELEEPVRYVPWCSVNPYPLPETKAEEMLKFPLYFNGPKPFECTVKAGDILYLPSMWFHHVRQTLDSEGRTISVNYWYDMQFDIKYAYFNFLQSLRFKSSPEPTFSIECAEDSQIDEAEGMLLNGQALYALPDNTCHWLKGLSLSVSVFNGSFGTKNGSPPKHPLSNILQPTSFPPFGDQSNLTTPDIFGIGSPTAA